MGEDMAVRRARMNAVSSAIGKKLLQGHRMLAGTCHVCNTVLMQDLKGKEYCLCCEMDQSKPTSEPASIPNESDDMTPKTIAAAMLAERQRELGIVTSTNDVVCTADGDGDVHDEPYWTQISAQSEVFGEEMLQSDILAKEIGEHLLRGYKMLDACCTQCDNVLLRDKSHNDICLHCRNNSVSVPVETVSVPASTSTPSMSSAITKECQACVTSVLSTMGTIRAELDKQPTVVRSMELIKLLCSCTEAIKDLKSLFETAPINQ